MSRSAMPEFSIWYAMKRRCTKPYARDFARYGGRGITVCERWMNFDAFIEDMGLRPSSKHSLERRDNDAGYDPENCHWATVLEQANNKRTSHIVEYRGEKMSVANAARLANNGVRRETAICRLKNGWTIEDAVETPPLFRRASDGTKIRTATAE